MWHAENTVGRYQTEKSWPKNKSTTDLYEKAINNLHIQNIFVDFKAAYDSIDINKLYSTLERGHTHKRMLFSKEIFLVFVQFNSGKQTQY